MKFNLQKINNPFNHIVGILIYLYSFLDKFCIVLCELLVFFIFFGGGKDEFYLVFCSGSNNLYLIN